MPNNLPDSSEDITSPQRIGQLMKELKENRTLLRVTIPEHKGSYTSTILGIDTQKGILLLDELNPALGHEIIQKAGTYRIHTQLNRVQIRFKGTISSISEEGGVAIYHTPIPASIFYAQNRQHFRSQTRITDRPRLNLTTSGGTSLPGLITDISIGGAGALLSNMPPQERGNHFPDCQIKLPSGQEIHCAAFIRHSQATEKPGQQKVGIQFSGLKPKDERAIQRFVADLQRLMLKR